MVFVCLTPRDRDAARPGHQRCCSAARAYAPVEEPLLLGPEVAGRIPDVLSQLGMAGGATNHGLVALAARKHGADVATRDVRAKATYDTVGVRVFVAV